MRQLFIRSILLLAALTYRPDAPDVQSLRGVVQGDYLYRIRGTRAIPLMAAIQSRPETSSAEQADGF